jgi:hypothetical protein
MLVGIFPPPMPPVHTPMRFIDLTKDFQDVCYLQRSKEYILKYFKEKTSKHRYTLENKI